MVKLKKESSFVCQECGYDSAQWMGKCPECGTWNSMKEVRFTKAPSSLNSPGGMLSQETVQPQTLRNIAYEERLRIQTGYLEMDTVLGGGIVKGSVLLLAGDPGIGKSTLLLQLCLQLASTGKKILYVSGEESADQIKMRASRVELKSKQAKEQSLDNLFLVSLTDADAITAQMEAMRPDLVIIDSIQTMQSQNAGGLAGAVGQVRYSALAFVRAGKSLNIPVIIVGHVTKEGMVAGPMVLSHMVDAVLFLEGEKFTRTRILRSLKNRFGPVDEVGIFLMEENGMQEVTSPEQMFLTKERQGTPGSVMVATMEGTRAFIVEIQALVVSSRLPMPRRVVSGVDGRRVELLLAVLQKHVRLPVDTTDVFVNVAGGLKLSDPAIDLGICLAIFSSIKNIPLDQTVGVAEIGLLGELRTVPGLDKRIREAQKLGFKHVITSKEFRSLREVLSTLARAKE